MSLNELRDECHSIAKEKGWHDNGPRNFGEALMLIVTEVAEAMEEHRERRDDLWFAEGSMKPEGVPIELADVLIRIFDLAGSLEIDLDTAVRLKIEYNKTRSLRHGGKVA